MAVRHYRTDARRQCLPAPAQSRSTGSFTAPFSRCSAHSPKSPTASMPAVALAATAGRARYRPASASSSPRCGASRRSSGSGRTSNPTQQNELMASVRDVLANAAEGLSRDGTAARFKTGRRVRRVLAGLCGRAVDAAAGVHLPALDLHAGAVFRQPGIERQG